MGVGWAHRRPAGVPPGVYTLRLLDLGFEKYINEVDLQQQNEPQMQKYISRIKSKLRPKTVDAAAK